MICIDMYVGQLETKHVNVLWHADQWTHMYISNKRLSIFLPFFLTYFAYVLFIGSALSVLHMWGHRFSPGWYCGSVAVK